MFVIIVSSKLLHLHTVYNHFTDNNKAPIVMENPGKKWLWKVMEKSWNIKNSEFHGNLFVRKKVMEISCPNPPNRVPINCAVI